MYICLGGGGVFHSCYFPPKESFSLPLSENHLMVFDWSGGGIERRCAVILRCTQHTESSVLRLEIPVDFFANPD